MVPLVVFTRYPLEWDVVERRDSCVRARNYPRQNSGVNYSVCVGERPLTDLGGLLETLGSPSPRKRVWMALAQEEDARQVGGMGVHAPFAS